MHGPPPRTHVISRTILDDALRITASRDVGQRGLRTTNKHGSCSHNGRRRHSACQLRRPTHVHIAALYDHVLERSLLRFRQDALRAQRPN